MILKKWNYKKHDYDDFEIPDNWNVKTRYVDDNEIVNCAQCGRKIKHADCYTSLEIHTDIGFGYGVCEWCYEQEWKRREKDRKNKEKL